MQTNVIHNQNCLEGLKLLPDNSIDCCVTSPPYFGLRDYGTEEQIGMEQTPDEFVDKLLQVFAEVKRVLKPEGTLWLNLGDSYNGSGKGAGDNNPNSKQATSKGTRDHERVPTKIAGLKPKDLIGIPWMVAKALQSSSYKGRIKNESDRIWLAAMIDGEGCIFIHKRKAGSSNHSKYTKKDGTISEYGRKNDTYGAGLEVANTHLSIIQRCMEITGVGSICTVERESALKKRNIPLHRWNVRSNECRWIIEEIYPYLVGKKHEAMLLLGCPNSGEIAERTHRGLMELHNGRTPDIDFPAPDLKKLYEQGWWLRQDIIWHKLNPMPESVTDRCTKSHEYIFLLSKSQKYYYDQESIKTEVKDSSIKRLMQDVENQDGSDRVPGKTNGRMKAVGSGVIGGNKHKNLDRDRVNTMHETRYRKGEEWTTEGFANKKSVWTVTTKPFKEAHFATFPEDLIVDCIKAGCPVDGIVLDPFMGAGTTALVSRKLNRNYIGFELNKDYISIANKRLHDELGFFI